MNRQTTRNARATHSRRFLQTTALLRTAFFLLLSAGAFLSSRAQVYTAMLNGANESPVNASPGTGMVTVTINATANTMRVQATFMGLTGTTSAAHIHASTATAGVGTAGVATTTPNFVGFPLGVTSGSFDMTYDMTLASSYNPAYVTANGGTVPYAFAALRAGIAAGKSYFNIHSSTFGGGEIRGFLAPVSLCYGYTKSNGHLISFYANNPSTLVSDIALTGLMAGETLVGFDYRPANGVFYGVTTTSSNTGRVVTINRNTGVVLSAGSALLTVSSTMNYAVDFNPVPDRIRLIAENGVSQRLNPNDGAFAATDSPLGYVAGDAGTGTPAVANASYDNSVAGATVTTLFGIDHVRGTLVRIGGVNGSPTPNLGATTTIGPLGVSPTAVGGFDIDATTNSAYAVLSVGGVSSLYSVNLATGTATLMGAVGTGATVDGLSIVAANPPPIVCYAYNKTNNHLVSFSSANPSVLLTDIALTGLNAGETIVGFDYRPAEGLFYGVLTNSAGNGKVVTISRTTGSVQAVGTAILNVSQSLTYGVDFNPVPDRIRLISSAGISLRLNPNDGTLAGTDTQLGYAAGDAGTGIPTVSNVAYDNSVAGTTITTLYGIDNARNTLVRIGGPNGTPSPNLGVTSTIGSLGVTTSAATGGFDIEPSNNVAYAVLRVGGVSGLYIIDLPTGSARLLGAVGDGTGSIDGLSIVPFFTTTCVAPASRIYVDAAVAVGGTGSSWGCAMKELSAAIATANGNPAIKSIFVAKGTYKPTTTTDRSAMMTISRGDLKILGGFNNGDANASDANPTLNATIVSGDIGTMGVATDNSYHLFSLQNIFNSSPLLMDGITIQDGYANGPGNDYGAGLLASYNGAASIKMSRVTFRSNIAANIAGAIYVDNSDITFDSCTFANNQANVVGAIFSFKCSLTFNNCVFAQNNGNAAGGGYYGNYGTATFNKTAFNGNTATYGAALFQNNLTAMVNNSVFSNNDASQQGGAIYSHNSSMTTVKNSTFYNNAAVNGSGGGAILINYGSIAAVQNSIFYKNKVGSNPAAMGGDIADASGGASSFNYNLLQANTSVPADNGGSISNNVRGFDPMFTAEATAIGADGKWFTSDDGLQLQNTSGAKNLGNNGLAPAGTDILNNTRIMCGSVDLGAYENQGACAGRAAGISLAPAMASAVVNPFSDNLQIKYEGSEKAAIAITSGNGRVMQIVGNAKGGITNVNTQSWTSGIYQVEVVTPTGKKSSFKVVKL